MTDYELRKHDIVVGSVSYPVEVLAIKQGESWLFNSDSLNKAQRNLARKLLIEEKVFNKDLMNFAIDVSGKKAAYIADGVRVTPAQISKARRTGQIPSPMFWKMFRIYLISLLEESQTRRDIDRVILEATG